MQRIFTVLVLVAVFLSNCGSSGSNNNSQETEEVSKSEERNEMGNLCFIHVEGRDTTFVNLAFVDSVTVNGYMAWEPWEKDGARGNLAGTLHGDMLELLWNYTIEGSEQSEDLVFRLGMESGLLEQKRGELEEKDPENPGHLKMKDPANAAFEIRYTRADCVQ